jgi:hypothetical protein
VLLELLMCTFLELLTAVATALYFPLQLAPCPLSLQHHVTPAHNSWFPQHHYVSAHSSWFPQHHLAPAHGRITSPCPYTQQSDARNISMLLHTAAGSRNITLPLHTGAHPNSILLLHTTAGARNISMLLHTAV